MADDMNPKKGNKFTIAPFNPLFTPFSSVHPWAKPNGKGTAPKGQRPYPEKEKAAPLLVLQHLANSSLCRAAALRSTQIVCPVLQQRHSLIQQQRLVVRRPHLVAFHVSKLPLNRIGPVSVLIGPGRKGRPPAMRCRAS